MNRTPTSRPQDSPDDEPDVLELAFALGQRVTGEVPITPEDREPPEVYPTDEDEQPEPVAHERQPA